MKKKLLKEAPHFSNQICPYCETYFNFDPKIETWTTDNKKNQSYYRFYTNFYKKLPCICPKCKKIFVYDFNLPLHNKCRKLNNFEEKELYFIIALKKMRQTSKTPKFDSYTIPPDFKSFAYS